MLDLGCGDGRWQYTIKHYCAIDGSDLSIQRLNASELAPHAKYSFDIDITKMDYTKLPKYDGAFLWGILHHVKDATPTILQQLRQVTDRIVILEPNGNHLMRKLLERTRSYRAAGEESFRTCELEAIFKRAGYKPVVWCRVNLFPNFTPKIIFRLLKGMEPIIESTPY